MDLFATNQNFKLPAFVSPFRDPMAIVTDAFLFPWDHMDLYDFPSFPATINTPASSRHRQTFCGSLTSITSTPVSMPFG
ncbi:hypothetical protein E2C01_045255 [Portunus trituberculatus]|uniref:Uncharacterized protein n=1 Tax=Portunus trituberculatus TaxID=210409 RepID=A0A5B7FV93_PORTR|nr:hypothetical protein [Portunus trituberculatus]